MKPYELIEVPLERPTKLIIKEPRRLPFYLKPTLDKEVEGKAHFVKFLPGRIQIDSHFVPFPTTIDGFKQFMKDINPGYHQSFQSEEKLLYEPLLNESQKSDLKETNECKLDAGDKLVRMGQILLFKEKHGERYRNFALNNVIHLNNYTEVPDELVIKSSLYLAAKLEYCGLFLPNMASQGSIARGNIIEEAYDGYFPLWILDNKLLIPFYNSIKGPSFRSFVIGDSPNTISSDLVLCYAYILLSTPSPSPYFCRYIQDIDYHPEAAFCACKIWINVDMLEITPVGVRVANMLWPEDDHNWHLPQTSSLTVYPWGHIKQVNVCLPMLWFLIEKLKLRLGKDFGIIEGLWVIPNGEPVYAWRDWARKIIKAVTLFPELKFLYQMAATGGKYRKGIKVDEFEYTYEWPTFANENPAVLAHLFDMTRVLGLLGAAQCKKVKGFAADGWVSEGGVPDKIGPIKIGAATYGPFPIKNTVLELYYQFDPLRHDEIISRDKHIGEFWRPLSEEYANEREMRYVVEATDNYGHTIRHEFHYKASSGDSVPDKEPEVCGDTLGQEIPTKPVHVTQIPTRLKYIREPQTGRARYGQTS